MKQTRLFELPGPATYLRSVDVASRLYLSPELRGHGPGLRLLHALIDELPVDANRLFIEHFVGNERAGGFYRHEGFVVDRIEPSTSDDPALGQMWRGRALT